MSFAEGQCSYGNTFLIPGENAINPCALELMILLTGLTLFPFGLSQLWSLVLKKSYGKIKYNKIGAVGLLRIAGVLAQGILIVSAKEFFLRANGALTLIIALPLTYLELFKEPVATGSLIFFWLLQFVFITIASIQNFFSDYKTSGNQTILYIALANAFHLFASSTFFYKPVHEVVKATLETDVVYSNILSRLTFVWMSPVIAKGYNQTSLTREDLPNPPAEIDPKVSYEKFKVIWEGQKKKSLLFTMIRVFGLQVLTAVFFSVSEDVLSFAEPQLLRMLINFFNEDQPYIVGFLASFGLFCTSMGQAALLNKVFITIYETSLGSKVALMTMIYSKAFKLSPKSKKERSTGDIVNHMAVDAYRIQELSNQFQMMVSAPIKLVLSLISLYYLLGISVFAGVLAMAIIIPLSSLLTSKMKFIYKDQMDIKDKRTHATSEILTNIKSIKLYAIEGAMLKKLGNLRNVLELWNLKKIGLAEALVNFTWDCIPFFVSCSTFAAFVLIEKRPLTPEIVFPAISLFNILAEPIENIPQIITSLLETTVAFERMHSFLLCDELDAELVSHFERRENDGEIAVKVSNSHFLWEDTTVKEKSYDEEEETAEPKTAVKIDSFEAKKGELTCIVGRVGSGKSAFLQSILGGLHCIGVDGKDPVIEVHGGTAYCAQVPWIMNTTVKENILFGHKYEEEFYQKTIEACELLPDLEILPDGDETQVGEKGISLSGGQKARLSLARAVYARADIYLLDDVLSAVDAHVGRNIIHHVINGILATKTIILSTNSIPVLNYANNIVLLANGHITETGSFKDVMGSETKLSTLLKEYGATFDVSGKDKEDNYESLTHENAERPRASSLRRASVDSFTPKKKKDDKDKKTAQKEEKSSEGKVKLSVYIAYIKACGIKGLLLFLFALSIGVSFQIVGNYCLKTWSENNEKNGSNKDAMKYVGIYAFFGITSVLLTLVRGVILWVFCSINASRDMHDKMAKAVVRSPMSFFETTPIGRIINRFSIDINRLDEGLPRMLDYFLYYSAKVLFTLFFIGMAMPSFLIVVVVLSVLYIYYRTYYIGASRELKRLSSVSRSPIFAHLQESLAGNETIRAFNQKARFQFLHLDILAYNSRTLYIFRSINRWLALRLQFIGACIIFTTASLAITHGLSAGMAGLVISFALQMTGSLSLIVRISVEVETSLVSIERILEYCDLKPEADEITEIRPPRNWPQDGSVKFDHYSTRYRENLDLVLNDVSLDIKPREKIGIVGRTGAGKSTLSLALFRLIEPASGNIFIDGMNTSELGLRDLRGNLAIIPQDSQAFEGTVRSNLDPLGEHTDEELWRALDLSHLKPFIQNLDKDNEEGKVGLEAVLAEGGSNLSVGQRQLLCLARALLNPSKVLVLDEATASVDVETDKIVQETIREAFSDRTILTIAHRIDTVLDSDKIVVLDRGKVKEFDSPAKLLENKESLFYSLCAQGGYVDKENK